MKQAKVLDLVEAELFHRSGSWIYFCLTMYRLDTVIYLLQFFSFQFLSTAIYSSGLQTSLVACNYSSSKQLFKIDVRSLY